MEARPVLDTKSEIFDAMVERFKFWMVSLLAASLISELQMAVQEKTSEHFPPKMIGYLGQWVIDQRKRKNGKRGPVWSEAEEDKVRSMHHALSL